MAAARGVFKRTDQVWEEITDAESREALLDAVAHGSTVVWQHLNLLGYRARCGGPHALGLAL